LVIVREKYFFQSEKVILPDENEKRGLASLYNMLRGLLASAVISGSTGWIIFFYSRGIGSLDLFRLAGYQDDFRYEKI
jgi:hypothetical protein